MIILVQTLVSLVNILELLVVIRCFLSWIPGLQNGFTELIYKLTDPFLLPIQKLLFRWMHGRMFMVDFSPIILYFILRFITRLLYGLV